MQDMTSVDSDDLIFPSETEVTFEVFPMELVLEIRVSNFTSVIIKSGVASTIFIDTVRLIFDSTVC